MTTETQWLRVSRELPCPVCEKIDWCLVAADKTACICPRTESAKRCGDAGFLHRLTDTPRQYGPRRVVLRPATAPPDLSALAASYRDAATPDRLAAFAAELGVGPASLTAFGVGWAAGYPAWAFPMTDPTTGTVTGIRLRPPVGKKFSVTGGKESLFLPGSLNAGDDPLLVCEGATDAIAAHTVGFPNAIGRPSCTGGTAHLVALVRLHKPARVVVVGDNDEPGMRGAEALASRLTLYARDVRVIAPPAGVKDLRAWVAAGATRPTLEHLIHAAARRQLNLSLTTKGT
ncbi:toprim domain-containing protein [Urbifossiella limnaea]|uniref:DNA primase n=1 Tax=Urbifossiella limnaea TaxID=2528023 RepID=A0A517XWH4_9BACT|nr:toprim domain-containing protein [Urbifossiella limnaea]QDU21824.1 DNA primase [Urbifossiella limnaea]